MPVFKSYSILPEIKKFNYSDLQNEKSQNSLMFRFASWLLYVCSAS